MKISGKFKTSKYYKISLSEGKKEVGRAYLYLIQNGLHKHPYGLMEDVFVESEYRSKGLGTKLVKEVIKAAKKYRCYKLVATSRTENQGLHTWYQKMGFIMHGVELRMNFVKNVSQACALSSRKK